MRAMLLTAPGDLVRDDVARPGANQGQLLVRVTHSGICGTDYKIFNGAIPVQYPRIMGHEIAGEVADPGASSLRNGERVIVGGVMEHIEKAGIHSGDAACALPPYSLGDEQVRELRAQTRALAKALGGFEVEVKDIDHVA